MKTRPLPPRKHDILWAGLFLLSALLPLTASMARGPGAPVVGGLPIVKLERRATHSGKKPEFLSVTLLPGRGMNVLQVTAWIPGKGVVELLNSPSPEVANIRMNGQGGDKFGNASTSFGGAFQVPYASRMCGELAPDGQSITAHWRNSSFRLPANSFVKYSATGLIRQAQIPDVRTERIRDGMVATAVLHAGDFEGRWVSKTDVLFKIKLTGSAFEASITSKNVGSEDEPMSIGWHPYINIPSGDRGQARLHLPASMQALVDETGAPTGELVPIKGTRFDFTSPAGAPLGDTFVLNFSHLERTKGSYDAVLSDPKSHYDLRVRAMSPQVKTITVWAPAARSFVAIEPQFNFSCPTSPVWKGMDTGMVTLKPGRSTNWTVRLELTVPAISK
jgi:aldose 1-epimerase